MKKRQPDGNSDNRPNPVSNAISEFFVAEERVLRAMLNDWRFVEWGAPFVVRNPAARARAVQPVGDGMTHVQLVSDLVGLGQACKEKNGVLNVTVRLFVGDYLRPAMTLPSETAVLAVFQPPLA